MIDDQAFWYIFIPSGCCKGFHFGEAENIPAAEREIEKYLRDLQISCPPLRG